jgi:hypothetical protein
MLEAIVIIVALGGLEIALWWADHKRQAEHLATLEAIWVELALLNEEKGSAHSTSPLGQRAESALARPDDLPIAAAATNAVAH